MNKKIGYFAALIVILIIPISIIFGSQNNKFSNYINEVANYKVLNAENKEGEIQITLEYANNEDWRDNYRDINEDINLETFYILHNLSTKPVNSMDEIKSVSISFVVSPSKKELALLKIDNRSLYNTNWKEKESFEIPQIVDYSKYNIN